MPSKKLLATAMLLGLLSSCAPKSHVSAPVDPCVVARWPVAPELNPQACGEDICLTLEDALLLTVYLGDLAEVRITLQHCPYVVYRD